jgi:hypothetical protein
MLRLHWPTCCASSLSSGELLYMMSSQVTSGKLFVCLFVYYFLYAGSFVPLGWSTNDLSHNLLIVSCWDLNYICVYIYIILYIYNLSYNNRVNRKYNSNMQRTGKNLIFCWPFIIMYYNNVTNVMCSHFHNHIIALYCTQLTPKTASVVLKDGRLTPETCRGLRHNKVIVKVKVY